MTTMNAVMISMATFVLFGLLQSELYADGEVIPAGNPERAQNNATLLVKYDSNHNGKLDADEIERLGHDRLLSWDTNKDGKLSRKELRVMQQAMVLVQ